MKLYKYRKVFKQLSKKEWRQYISGFFVAWAIAVIIIIGGVNLTEKIPIVWLNKVLAILFIFTGLTVAGIVMNKTLPEK